MSEPGIDDLASGIELPAGAEPVVQRDLVVVGASAGGVPALQELVAALPPELPAAILVVLHMMQQGTSVLASILDRAGPLPATQAEDGERPERGHVYVASPNCHLLLRGPDIHLSGGPRENGHRPAINPLFRSAARAYGRRAIGVVLSGTLDDGTNGLRLIKQRGGATVVQDPDDAAYDEMPRNAIQFVEPDVIVPIAAMGETLQRLIDEPLDPAPDGGISDPGSQERDLVEAELGFEPPNGSPSTLTCPDCGGVLTETNEGEMVHFACQIGHGYSPESLVAEQGAALESALWSAMRTLEERADLLRRMVRRAERSGGATTGQRLELRAAAVSDQAEVIRRTILRLRGIETGAIGEAAA